jgi:hypothetical protein
VNLSDNLTVKRILRLDNALRDNHLTPTVARSGEWCETHSRHR